MITFTLVIGLILVMVWFEKTYRKLIKRPEFQPLVEDGYKFRFNVLWPLWVSHNRSKEDPLKPVYKQIYYSFVTFVK